MSKVIKLVNGQSNLMDFGSSFITNLAIIK